jgi:hypothetical protein
LLTPSGAGVEVLLPEIARLERPVPTARLYDPGLAAAMAEHVLWSVLRLLRYAVQR